MEPPETGKSADSRGHSVRVRSDRRWVEEQRELVQEALLEGEERLQALLDDCMAAVYLKDLEGRYLKANRWADIMFRLTREEALGKTDHELWPKEVADALRANDLKALKAEAPLRFEQRFLREDGEYTYKATKFPLYDSGGDLYAVCGIAIDVTERKRAEDKAEESEERFRALVRNSSDVVTILDADGTILYVSPAIESVLGYRPEGRIGENAFDHVHPDDAERAKGLYAQAANDTGDIGGPQQFRMRHADGSWRYVETIRNNLLDDPSVRGIVVNLRDVTERTEAEEALRESEERYRAVMEQSADGIWLFDPDTKRLLEFNESFQELLGYEAEEFDGMTIYDFIAHDPEDIDAVTERNIQVKRRFLGERRYRRKDGSLIDVEVSANVIPYFGREVMCGVARDITGRKALEERLRRQVFYDPLTELPNRTLFLDRLGHALAQMNRLKEPVAVLFVDLDNFKVVNDSLGHDAGNALLVGVAERLRGCVRPGDTVARLFGDEFAILLEDPAELDHARRVTERIGERLQGPFLVDGQEAFVSASIGIALSDSSGDQPKDVLRRADLAMYAAKSRRKARYEVFQPSMDTRAMERLDLENQLRRAIEREEFEVHYQPVVDIGSGEVNGLEALARWRHPERGLVSPEEFIVLAEETGLIRPIGRWVLEEACRQAVKWREHYPEREILMSVNLSTSEFSYQPDLMAQVLEETGMDPEGLQLEITERVVMDDAEFSLGKLQKLKGLGVRFAIDDYGTGYSCLYYLKRMPVSLLKIDRTFIAGLGSDQGDEAIVAGTVSLAHALGLEVIAEGVETADQLAKLEELGCDMVQGFYFSRPLPSEAIESLLDKGL